MSETTRYCALCGQCEACMSDLEERCWDADDSSRDHVWNAPEPMHELTDAES